MRADIALVERGLARSRNHASTLIEAKRVLVQGKEVRKSSQNIEDDIQIVVLDAIEFVSRAGHKLARALEEFSSIEVQDKNCLDVGASTGGFTDVLLRLGAELVVAVDVGHEQMVAELFDHPRVFALEGFNARDMTIEALRSATRLEINEKFFDLVVADVSFISLTLVLPAMRDVAPGADFVLLIKPQFEVGKDSLSANGIVNDHRLRAQAIKQVVDCAEQLGMGVRGLVRSGLPGTHGNVEYVLWISANEPKNGSKWTDQIEEIAREGK
ncbi:MAG: TlyA family RNA methyltransferase [Rhodoluna sp.]|jgi:23S rRNA (cytidine1920-2'-O)/16S rRNA (cytidine1409-2'-O)-methyltransferase|nr:TlyA family RNA methyltransferase [Rhodoluna sp.]